MAKVKTPSPVKLIVGMISRFEDAFLLAAPKLENLFGPVDLQSPLLPFDKTDYYQTEMGTCLKRKFLSFSELIPPDTLAQIKIQTNALEHELSLIRKWPVARPINLDPGYVTASKLVLATAKDFSHRIHLGQGIYAEVTLSFHKGGFEPWPWTYPDYRSPEYRDFFTLVRTRYLETLKQNGSTAQNQSPSGVS